MAEWLADQVDEQGLVPSLLHVAPSQACRVKGGK